VKAIVAALLITASSVGSALAAETTHWATVGPWAIIIDHTTGNGCFILSGYPTGTIIRVGLDNKNKNGYVLIGNPKWRSLELGKEYQLTFQFDGDAPWTGPFTAMSMGSSTVLFAPFSNSNFFRDFAAKPGLRIYYESNEVARLQLNGTYAAMKALVDCQDKVDGVTHDPLTRSGTQSSFDPFAQ
jgi:hypothetical protein